jgi:hypothetical protein
MKRLLLRAILPGLLAIGAARLHAETDAQTNAHRAILDLAGAFTNDGFKLRDGDFTGTLAPGKSVVVQVNLYAGNQYWFAVSTADSKTTVSIAVYDEGGNVLKTEPFTTQAPTPAKGAAAAAGGPADFDPDATATNRAAAGYAPDLSGPYYVRITNTAAAPATYCLIYSYK